MQVKQLDFSGNSHPATGHWAKDQLARIMDMEPETLIDEDLLAARWLQVYQGFDDIPLETLVRLVARYRKVDVRNRRLELSKEGYPYPPEEAARRKKRSKGGRP